LNKDIEQYRYSITELHHVVNTQDCDHNAMPISFSKSATETSTTKKDTLDCSFIYTQILKDI